MQVISTFLLWFWLGFPLVAWILNLALANRLRPIKFYIATCFVGWALFVTAANLHEWELRASMDAFDLDGNGSLSPEELTPEAELASNEWSGYGSHFHATTIGIPITAVLYTIQCVVLLAGQWIFANATKSRAPQAQTVVDYPNVDSDSNPYQSPSKKRLYKP